MALSVEEVRRRHSSSAARVPPHNLVAEASLLGAMLLSRDAIVAAVECQLAEADFYKPAYGHIYEAVTALYARGEAADPVTVAEFLHRAKLLEAVDGPATLISLQAGTPAIGNASRYARIVQEHSLLRRLIGVAGDIAELGYGLPDDVAAAVDEAEAMVFKVAEHRVTDSMASIREVVGLQLDHLEALAERAEAVTGVPTGYRRAPPKRQGVGPAQGDSSPSRRRAPVGARATRHAPPLPAPWPSCLNPGVPRRSPGCRAAGPQAWRRALGNRWGYRSRPGRARPAPPGGRAAGQPPHVSTPSSR